MDDVVLPENATNFWMKVHPINPKAELIIFPNLESANLSYKIIRGMKVAQVVGPILLGLKQPVHVLQMRASVDEIVNLATIAVLDAQMREND